MFIILSFLTHIFDILVSIQCFQLISIPSDISYNKTTSLDNLRYLIKIKINCEVILNLTILMETRRAVHININKYIFGKYCFLSRTF